MSSLSYAEQLRNDLFRAYEDARKNKRNTIAQLEFEKDAEHNLIELYHELLDGSYVPGKSICFLTHFPVLREVFASQFRDRVVHHLLFNYIAPIFEKTFIYDSYSCRKEKGTLFGVERLEHHIRSCTNNYTHTAYILKLDIQGYFMSKAKKIISFSTRDELTIGQLEAIRASLNSYLGYLGHYKSYKIIHKSLTGSAVFKHLYFASGYKKSIPYKRYTNKRRERCEIAHDLNRILTA